MGTVEYASLHNHTEYSLLDGHGKPKEYVERALELGQRALGITDHGNLFGVYEMVNLCKKAGIIPVPGIEAYVAPQNPEGARVQTPVFYGETIEKPTAKGTRTVASSPYDVASSGSYLHMTLWARNNTGLHNLFRLTTESYKPENTRNKPRIDLGMLEKYSEGLVVATGCPSSEISTRLLLGQKDKAEEYAATLMDIFGRENVFMEVMEHNMQGVDIERKLHPLQIDMAKRMNIPFLATNDCHYTKEEDALSHEEFLCMQSGAKMSDPVYDQGGNRFAFNGSEYFLRSTEEMLSLFPPEYYPGALSNTLLVAEMASDISLEYNPNLRPKPILPPGFDNEAAYFKHLLREGFQEKYGNSSDEVQAEAKKRLNEEYQVLYSSDFIGYMLVVRDYIKYTVESFSVRDANGTILAPSVGPGRGSVGGSVTAYVLGISEVDPVRHGTLFERFLGAGRGAKYRIEYEDGTYTEHIASDPMLTSEGMKKYVWQLAAGETIQVEDKEG